MLDRKYILENASRSNRTAATGTPTPTSTVRPARRRAESPPGPARTTQPAGQRVSKSIGKAKDAAEREAARKKAAACGRDGRGPAEGRCLAAEADAIHRMIPNLSHPAAPVGVDDKANLELFRGKTPLPTFDFPPLDHVDLSEKLGWWISRGAPAWRGTGSSSSRTRRSSWSWPCNATPWKYCSTKAHADHHARPGPKRGARRRRVHSSRPGKRKSTASKAPT